MMRTVQKLRNNFRSFSMQSSFSTNRALFTGTSRTTMSHGWVIVLFFTIGGIYSLDWKASNGRYMSGISIEHISKNCSKTARLYWTKMRTTKPFFVTSSSLIS